MLKQLRAQSSENLESEESKESKIQVYKSGRSLSTSQPSECPPAPNELPPHPSPDSASHLTATAFHQFTT